MHPLIVMFLVFAGYLVMYHLYGKFISRRIFKIDEKFKVPAETMYDGFDYVPTKKEIIFGHHFTSIAGTGPIVGPAIAIIWGWVPAVLWVFFGSIFIGAVHDYGTLITSMRHRGHSIAEITGIYLNKRTKIFFYIIGLLELWILIAVLGLVMAIIFDMYPGSVVPVWLEIPIAVWLGHQVYKRGKDFLLPSIFAVVIMYITVIAGNYFPVNIIEICGIPATGIWTIILLIYAFIASIIPVTTLLQPRDYINSHQLLIAMGLLMLGIIFTSFGTGLEFVAPTFNLGKTDAPAIWPTLFIIIACGAVSGFHAIVASGTTSKQISNEKDALFVGYGSMLTEGALALLVIIAVGAGIGLGFKNENGEMLTGISAWSNNYGSWAAASGMNSKISAFVDGSANMITSIGIPRSIAIIIMGVFVASFAGTTLDTSARLQRFFLQELFGQKKSSPFRNKYFSTSLVILSAGILAFVTGADGKGALSLWPLFGTINQIIAALALIVLTIYLKKKGGLKWLITGIPAIFMSINTLWASLLNQISYTKDQDWLLVSVNIIVIVLAFWIIFEGLVIFIRSKTKATKAL
ncbi:MAG TPA: carbon starvation protein A [Bacteroidales bacterium]|nr:carbon starvation protein A [Bacteroidales bacterium]